MTPEEQKQINKLAKEIEEKDKEIATLEEKIEALMYKTIQDGIIGLQKEQIAKLTAQREQWDEGRALKEVNEGLVDEICILTAENTRLNNKLAPFLDKTIRVVEVKE